MRLFYCLLLLALAMPGLPAARAAEEAPAAPVLEPGSPDGPPPGAATAGVESMDSLFEELRTAASADAASRVERQILRRWFESGSDTVDLLMDWSIDAIAHENYPLALDYLNAVVMLAPDFAEGWNKRASVHFLTDDYGKALADLRHVLALEPRHFGALSGLGIILRELGRDDQALAAFRAALAVHPFLDEVRDAAEELERSRAGQGI